MLKVPPGLVAEGDARSRRTNPPQSPTQGIDWCGVVQAVHLSLYRSNGSGWNRVRLTDMRKSDSAANWVHPGERTEFMHPTGIKDLREQTPGGRDRAWVGSQPGARLGSCGDVLEVLGDAPALPLPRPPERVNVADRKRR